MPTSIVFEEVGFNADAIAAFANEADFIKSHTGQKVEVKEGDKVVKMDHQSTDLSVDQLKEVYKLAGEAVKAHPTAANKKSAVGVTHTDVTGNVVAAQTDQQKK